MSNCRVQGLLQLMDPTLHCFSMCSVRKMSYMVLSWPGSEEPWVCGLQIHNGAETRMTSGYVVTWLIKKKNIVCFWIVFLFYVIVLYIITSVMTFSHLLLHFEKHKSKWQMIHPSSWCALFMLYYFTKVNVTYRYTVLPVVQV